MAVEDQKSVLPQDIRDLIKYGALISAAIVVGKVIEFVLAL